MNSILEDLYFGELDVNTQGFESGSSQAKAMEIIDDREEKLSILLEGKERSMFLEYANAWSEIHAATAYGKFTLGFKVGTRLAVEGLLAELQEVYNSTYRIRI